MQYIKAILLLIAALTVVILAFGLGIVAVISVLLILPVIRFFLTRSPQQEADMNNDAIDVEYEIIEENTTEVKKEKIEEKC